MLQTEHVAVIIEADHLCVASPGMQDVNISTIFSSYHGKFLNSCVKDELLRCVYDGKRE